MKERNDLQLAEEVESRDIFVCFNGTNNITTVQCDGREVLKKVNLIMKKREQNS